MSDEKTEETDLAVVGDEDELAKLLATQQKATEEELAVVSTAGKWFPRLQLMIANSKPCKNPQVKFPVNHYAMVRGQTLTDLGEHVDVLPLVYRPKALDTSETIINNYTPSSEQFQRIMSTAENEKDSGCTYGPEYLCWLPSQKEFVTFFMNSVSSRNEAPAMKARLGKPCTLKSQYINPDKSKYDWYAPTVVACSTPFEMPTKKDLLDATERYNALEDTKIEKVIEEQAGDDRR